MELYDTSLDKIISISSARHGTSFHTPVLEYPNVRKRMKKKVGTCTVLTGLEGQLTNTFRCTQAKEKKLFCQGKLLFETKDSIN